MLHTQLLSMFVIVGLFEDRQVLHTDCWKLSNNANKTSASCIQQILNHMVAISYMANITDRLSHVEADSLELITATEAFCSCRTFEYG